jgi:hypothetical protein
MGRLVDVLSVVMLLAAVAAFALGMNALGDQRDLAAIYWLVVGGLILKASVDLLRPGRVS